MHIPVLLHEVLEGLRLQPNQSVIDGTVGGGGHARAILEQTRPNGIVIGCDRDRSRLQNTTTLLQDVGPRFIPIHDSYATVLEHVAEWEHARPIMGILLDLGLSSFQIDDSMRGFSFRFDGPLDMRFDTTRGQTAADIVNTRSAEQLQIIFQDYGEVQRSRSLAAAIVETRVQHPYQSTIDILETIDQVYGRAKRRGLQYPEAAPQVFQALRIATNAELEQLQRFLPIAMQILVPGGRLAVITFHSIEDRMVKQFMVNCVTDCVCPPEFPECRCDHRAIATRVTRKAIVPTTEEIATNPRARSAHLRIIEKK